MDIRTAKIHFRAQGGQLSLQTIIFAAVAVIFISGFVLWAASFLQLSLRSFNRLRAFSIAEAGIEYYRWHLAHDPDDYQDGTGQPGPYAHDYYDKNGALIGQFVLEIVPPSLGSTVVEVQSTGNVATDATISKIIKVKFDMPSLTKYAMVGNQELNITSSTTIYGLVHANGGIRFDGKGYNLVTSALETYNDPDHSGSNEHAVHTHVVPVDPLPPTALPVRTDVFVAGRQFPIPAIDFNRITSDLATIKNNAQLNGRYIASSTNYGYHIALKTNHTFDLYEVTKLLKKPPSCNDPTGQDGWGTWTIDDETLIQNYPYPASGLIFVEGDVWVDGQVNADRITIAAGYFPENAATDKSIIINNDILYTNYDGRDVIGLIAQKNVNFGLHSEDDLRIDAAMVAKNGRIGRYDYRPGSSQGNGCQPYHVRTVITTYGMLATNQNWLFNYSDYSGYQLKNLNYDPNLLYNPPPGFPLLTDKYEQISWDEVK